MIALRRRDFATSGSRIALVAVGVSLLLALVLTAPADAHNSGVKHGRDLSAFLGDHNTGTIYVCDREADSHRVVTQFYIYGRPNVRYSIRDPNGAERGCGRASVARLLGRIWIHRVCELGVGCSPWRIHSTLD